MVEFEVVMDKLNGFETADEIADYFQYYGIKAVIISSRHCAVSQFINKETGLTVSTNRDQVRAYRIDDREYTPDVVQTSPILNEFIRNFDRGYYPDLVTTEKR